MRKTQRSRAGPGKASVWELRTATLDLSAQDARAIAEFILGNQPDSPQKSVAFVMGQDVDFGMARVFQVYREDSDTPFRVFRNYDEALEWTRCFS